MDFSLQGYLVFHFACSVLSGWALLRLVPMGNLAAVIALIACLLLGPLVLVVMWALILVTANDDRPRLSCRHYGAKRCAARHNRRHNDGR